MSDIPLFPQRIQGIEAGGVIDAATQPVPLGFILEIERMTVQSTSSATTQARIYRGAVRDENLETGSNAGNFDDAEFNPPLRLAAGEILRVRWSNAPSAGSIGRASIQGRLRALEANRVTGTERRAPKPARNAGGW